MTTELDMDARYTVEGGPAVAYHLLGYVEESDEDTEWSGVTNTNYQLVRAVMVGDDRVHEVDVDDLRKLEAEDYCTVCGQLGCGHNY